MKKWVILLPVLAVLTIPFPGCAAGEVMPAVTEDGYTVALPEPFQDSDISIEVALQARRSVRNFSDEAVKLYQLGQFLWAGQGITRPNGFRTAPSAGGLYPLKLYVVAGNVAGLFPGVYRYEPENHSLVKIIDGDRRQVLMEAALNQPSVSQGAFDIVITAVYEITTVKYGERGIRYVHMEAGHAAQNICLQAVALKLGVVTIGAFDDAGVQKVLGLPQDEIPLYIIPAGNLMVGGG